MSIIILQNRLPSHQLLVSLPPVFFRDMRRLLYIFSFLLALSHSGYTLGQSFNGTVQYDTIYNPLCQGDSVFLNDSLIHTAGVYYGYELREDSSIRHFCVIVDVYPAYNDTIRAYICAGDTFTQYGFCASRTGSYTQYRHTRLGCDSNITLILSVTESVNDTIHAVTCSGQPYTGFGFNESLPGTYTHNGYSIAGCDSNVTLILSVDTEYNDTIWATINSGESYNMNGFDEYEAGTYLMTRKTVLGCDSNITLVLTQNILDTIIDVLICQGDTFWLDGKPYTETGSYYDITSFGAEVCPYHLILNVTHSAGTALKVTDATICADEGILEIHYEYTSDVPAKTASIHFINGTFHDISGIPLYSDTAMLSVPLMEPTTDSTNYPRPDSYMGTLTIDNGVCNPNSTEFRFDILYPSWLIHQKWNDVLMVLNEHYNGGYVFTHFQWYKDGVRIDGEKGAYIYLPEHLDLNSEYYVELTREDDNKTIRTCSLIPELRDSGYVEYANPFLTVYPTIVERSEAIVTVSTNSKGEYWVYTPTGKLIEYNTYDAGDGSTFQLNLPYISNVYFIKFKTDDNTTKTERIIVH